MDGLMNNGFPQGVKLPIVRASQEILASPKIFREIAPFSHSGFFL
jgi:hypothetical protein